AERVEILAVELDPESGQIVERLDDAALDDRRGRLRALGGGQQKNAPGCGLRERRAVQTKEEEGRQHRPEPGARAPAGPRGARNARPPVGREAAAVRNS